MGKVLAFLEAIKWKEGISINTTIKNGQWHIYLRVSERVSILNWVEFDFIIPTDNYVNFCACFDATDACSL